MTESFFQYPNNKYVLLALLGATAGQGVVWYMGAVLCPVLPHPDPEAQLYRRLCIDRRLVDYRHAVLHLLLVVRSYRPAEDHHGRLRHRGAHRLPPGLTHYVNPDLEAFQTKNQIAVSADPAACHFQLFVGPWSKFSNCDRAKDFVSKLGLSFRTIDTPGTGDKDGDPTINAAKIEGFGAARWTAAFNAVNVPKAADPTKVNWIMAELILVIMVIYVTMVYGPIAAFLVELFPTKIRYTSMSLPYQSAMAGSAACCRSPQRPWWQSTATFTTAFGIRSSSPSRPSSLAR